MTNLPADTAARGSGSLRPPRRWVIPSIEVTVLAVAAGLRPEQAGRLRALGADFGQGFHFARPLNEGELGDYLRGSSSSSSAAAASA